MKRIIFSLLFLFSILFPLAYAGGGMTHMFIAQETIALLPDAQLRNLILNNLDAYVVGAYYPDSGFVGKNLYGEDSHWDPFIYTFADEIKGKYNDPIAENPRLVAFLLGCAVHRVSDEVIHWTFYDVMKKKDFNNDYNAAHQYGDTGIDLLINIDKNQWLTHPLTWWVPVSDLVEVYHRMGKDQYTADQIISGNAAIAVAGYGERAISLPAYPYLKWKMPWTAANYYDWPQGGIKMDEEKVAAYEMNLWHYLQNKSATHPVFTTPTIHYSETTVNSPIFDFAKAALEKNAVKVAISYNADGSIELQKPVILETSSFRQLVNQFVSRLISSK